MFKRLSKSSQTKLQRTNDDRSMGILVLVSNVSELIKSIERKYIILFFTIPNFFTTIFAFL